MSYVQFNGGPSGLYGAPKDLQPGGFYEVIEVLDCGFCTKYSIKGVDGYHNSTWFTPVERSSFLTTKYLPKVDQPCKGKTFIFGAGGMKECEVKTSPVKRVKKLCFNLFEIETMHNVYTVHVV
ncbi:MAG: hypothetical protein J6C46_01810 [Clostridia bacterium]|nr:hypothetical protein [Clostridia bacterium]